MMSTPLLATKLLIPPLRPHQVRRPQLIDKLSGSLAQNSLLALVCAPAGYGKTTLIREWLQTISEQGDADSAPSIGFAWITLDQADDDLANFLNYLVAALQTVQPGIGEGVKSRQKASRPASGKELATLLINDLVEISDRILLVLDDYHLISAQPVHDFLSFLIEHRPPQLCLVIASRADPPLPLSRFRARGQLVEIRLEDLHFSHEETVEFLDRELGISLTTEQYHALETRLEGWVAGLQLAALSMRDVKDAGAFIEALSGRQEHIADYLADEVLTREPETVVSFLLQTSILDQLTAPLCDAVTGQTRSQEILEYLMEANLFLVSLDQRREWFRYHALFADLLRKRLHSSNGELEGELHRRASRWYQEKGFLSQAIEHALAGEDFDRAGALVERLADEGLAHGKTKTLLRWLETLPQEVKDDRLRLWVYHGLVLMMWGQVDTPVQLALERQSGSMVEGSVQGEIALLRALRALMEGNTNQAISLSGLALKQIPADRLFFRSLAADSLGMAFTLQGDTAAAIKAYEQVADLSTRAGNDMMAILALSSMAGLYMMRGQLQTSAAICQSVMEKAADHFGKGSPYTGKALLGLGELAREWNDLDAALRYFLESIEAFGQFSEIGLGVGYLSIARLRLSQRDWEAVQESILKARQASRASKSTPMDDLLTDLMQARFWIARGELELASQWARSHGLLDRSSPELIAGQERAVAINELLHGQYLVLARLFLALEQPVDALKVIEPLLANSLKFGHLRRGIEYLVLKALALQQQQDLDQAVEVIGEALRLGEAEGFQRVFLDEGKPMAQLLYRAAERKIHPAYAGKILSRFSSQELYELVKETRENRREVLIEPLSDREMEVLSLIFEGLSNREIAGRLYISISTVKVHIAHIFGKLGVKSRTQAVSRARDFGLLPGH